MTNRSLIAAVLTAVLGGSAGIAQTASDLLQKGIHAQETVGDVDGAIQIFRQVVSSPSTNKTVAAQAQYQLVVCMVQRGDRAAARKELDLLARNFPDQQDLLGKARKLVPGGDSALPAPWGELEGAQLNIKRDGTPTGDYLFYSVDPGQGLRSDNAQAVVFRWELITQKTRRHMRLDMDREMHPLSMGNVFIDSWLYSTDDFGDPMAAALSGPAIDQEQSVFLLRRLPLAVGFKTTLTSTPFTLGSTIKGPVEALVTGIENVQTPAGKFNCFKISMPSIGQTFWIGMEAARPLVKIQAGRVEAELVAVWTTDLLDAVVAPLKAAGWKVNFPSKGPGPVSSASAAHPGGPSLSLTVRKVRTPRSEIAMALQKDMADMIRDQTTCCGVLFEVRPQSVESLTIGGNQALRCVGELSQEQSWKEKQIRYYTWIRSENAAVEVSASVGQKSFPVLRWRVDPALMNIKLP